MNKELQPALEYFQGDELAASTWKNKYAAPGEKTPEDMHDRLAKEIANVEYNTYTKNLKKLNPEEYADLSKMGKEYLGDMKHSAYSYDDVKASIIKRLTNFEYIIPGGSIMSTLGTDKLSSLSNCFVIDAPVDSISGIMKQCNKQGQLMKNRGGVGFDISTLRPNNAKVDNAAKTSTGAASFMDLFSFVTNLIAQNNRRGALMMSMSINHPDIEEFITKKQDLTKVTGANVSVAITDEFMECTKKGEDYLLRFPVDMDIQHLDSTQFNYGELCKVGEGYVKKINATKLWEILIHCAWKSAEPGILFMDRIHNYSPDGVYPQFKATSTNPSIIPQAA